MIMIHNHTKLTFPSEILTQVNLECARRTDKRGVLAISEVVIDYYQLLQILVGIVIYVVHLVQNVFFVIDIVWPTSDE